MSRFCNERNSQPLIEAGSIWLRQGLYQQKSILSDHTLWTLENTKELETYFSNNPDTGTGDFFDKLETQLESCNPAVKQLAAEMLWLMLLCVSNIGATKKRNSVLRVWAWSGEALPEDHPLLSDTTLAGVGSGGTSFNTNRWRELGYCIDVTKQALAMPLAERKATFSGFKALGEWLTRIPESEKRQFRHMLLYMLHPDEAERIFSNGDRMKIAQKFTGKPKKALKALTSAEMDQLLLSIRREQEEAFGTQELCFYVPPLKELWKAQSSRCWLFAWNPANWDWEALPDHIAQTKAGSPVTLGWSCSNQDVAPGDRVWLIRQGQEPRGIMASGNVVSEPYEAEHYDAEATEAGETTMKVDVEFNEIRDVFKDPLISMEDLGRITIDNQNWAPQSSGVEIKPRSAALLDKLWTKLATSAAPAKPKEKTQLIAEPINKILPRQKNSWAASGTGSAPSA